MFLQSKLSKNVSFKAKLNEIYFVVSSKNIQIT